MTKPDPLAALLNETPPAMNASHVLKIDKVFGDRPEVKASILRMRARGDSADYIADVLTKAGHPISGKGVTSWLNRQNR